MLSISTVRKQLKQRGLEVIIIQFLPDLYSTRTRKH